ncbi:MAG: DUF2726 domain-containing protein [Roseinatronobacter sp.]
MFDAALSSLVTLGAWLVAALAVLTLIQIAVRRIVRRKRSAGCSAVTRERVRTERKPPTSVQGDQLADVQFQRRPLLNKTEFRVFALVDRAVANFGRGHKVMAQVSLGEVLQTNPAVPNENARRAYGAINAKRLDIAVIDRSGMLALAIEVQGSGHYQSSGSYLRDAVKREALRRAGVAMLEVTPDWDSTRIEAELAHRLAVTAAA